MALFLFVFFLQQLLNLSKQNFLFKTNNAKPTHCHHSFHPISWEHCATAKWSSDPYKPGCPQKTGMPWYPAGPLSDRLNKEQLPSFSPVTVLTQWISCYSPFNMLAGRRGMIKIEEGLSLALPHLSKRTNEGIKQWGLLFKSSDCKS